MLNFDIPLRTALSSLNYGRGWTPSTFAARCTHLKGDAHAAPQTISLHMFRGPATI